MEPEMQTQVSELIASRSLKTVPTWPLRIVQGEGKTASTDDPLAEDTV